MSSVTRRGKFWHACYRNASGERVTRSTKMTDKKKALAVVQQWETTARGELVATHVQRAMADIYRQATGKEAPTFTVRGYAQLLRQALLQIGRMSYDFSRGGRLASRDRQGMRVLGLS